jgi:hypothetical protein
MRTATIGDPLLRIKQAIIDGLAPDVNEQRPVIGAPVITTESELAAYLRDTFGVRLPSTRVCPTHCSPWEAFCEAYFARSPVSVWKASRGLGGKSFTLSLLGLVEAVTLGVDVNVVGGSGEQAQRVLEAMGRLWDAPSAPRAMLASEPAQRHTKLVAGNVIRALMASTKSVRGPHPVRLRLDEVDEMDLAILDAAMGQPMSARGVLSQTVMSSTHQYPDGTMTQILQRAKERNWPIREWCWRESMAPHGWLDPAEIERKRQQVTDAMWKTEYDLQEPSAEGRAIMTEKVAAMFARELGHFPTGHQGAIEAEPPDPKATYATGADWAKEQDWTVIVTFRTDVTPWRLVAFERLQRRPWPDMVSRLDARIARYAGSRHLAAHDATGGGNVVSDLIEHQVEGVIMVGRERSTLFSNYIKGIEHDELRAPFIETMEAEHRYATVDDLFGAGHPPDSLVAGALAYRAAVGRGRGFLDWMKGKSDGAASPALPPPAAPGDDADALVMRHQQCRIRGMTRTVVEGGRVRCATCGCDLGRAG